VAQEIRTHPEQRSLGELFAELTRETTTLVRQEVALAKSEIRQKLASIGKDVGYIAIGGAIAYAGLLALIAALVLGIAAAANLPLWASALLVGAVIVGIGGLLVMSGLKALKHMDPVPRQTVETLKEDIEWAKHPTS
jgi:hypothetical protein